MFPQAGKHCPFKKYGVPVAGQVKQSVANVPLQVEQKEEQTIAVVAVLVVVAVVIVAEEVEVDDELLYATYDDKSPADHVQLFG